jgi:HD-GYP domain-containing protein (c-di-GMP phosphodiesterase class II)
MAFVQKYYRFDAQFLQPWIMRMIFGALFISMVCADVYVFPEKSMPVLYFLSMIAAGVAFWNRMAICIGIALFSTFLYYSINPECIPMNNNFPDYDAILLHLVDFLFPAVIIPLLIRQSMHQKNQLMDTISALVKALDSRDSYTAAHSENVANYARLISRKMKLSRKECETIYTGGLLHDIGKIGIPENILNKKDRLTADEYNIVKKHPVIGYNTLKHVDLFKKNGILDIILYHHERYDGKGYPKGLQGSEIPLYARILCVADCLDAMLSNRVYRKGLKLDQVIRELNDNSGTQFDPAVVQLLTEDPKTLESLIRKIG